MLTLTVPMIFGFVATLAITFSFALYHCITIKEEYKHNKKMAVEAVEELESVETSQTLRTQRERFEEQMETLDKRIHLITFRATQEEAEYIVSELPISTYLYNLSTTDLDDHVFEVRLKRARSNSI